MGTILNSYKDSAAFPTEISFQVKAMARRGAKLYDSHLLLGPYSYGPRAQQLHFFDCFFAPHQLVCCGLGWREFCFRVVKSAARIGHVLKKRCGASCSIVSDLYEPSQYKKPWCLHAGAHARTNGRGKLQIQRFPATGKPVFFFRRKVR
jgi:hypothetical protein